MRERAGIPAHCTGRVDAEELRFHHEQALKTVLPIRRQTKEVQKREIVLLIPKTEAQQKLALFEQKHYTAKARLLRELIQEPYWIIRLSPEN